jgi:hypothetical protein
VDGTLQALFAVGAEAIVADDGGVFSSFPIHFATIFVVESSISARRGSPEGWSKT